MGLRAPRPARRALRCYLRRGISIGSRLHVAVRWISCPFPAVEALVPTDGQVLEVGCGHGLCSLYLALASPGRDVFGVDIDGHKLSEARRAAATAGARAKVAFAEVPAGWQPIGEWPSIVIVDVLYLLGAEAAGRLLASSAAAVAAGGRLIVKEIDTQPRWKYRLAVGQELAATRLARVTAGDTVEFLAPDRMEAIMADAGLHVWRRRVDRGYPHPHLLLVGDRQRRNGGEPTLDPDDAGGSSRAAGEPGRVLVGAYAGPSWS